MDSLIVGHDALAKRAGWSGPSVSRSLYTKANRRRQDGTSQPSDLPAADGYEKHGSNQLPYWYESTIAAWEPHRRVEQQRRRNHADGTKTCTACGVTKPLSEYYRYTDRKGCKRPQSRCKSCMSDVAKAWSRRNPEKAAAATAAWKKRTKRYYKARQYGLDEIELAAMEAAQQGHCTICGEFSEPLHIDHCHKNGLVRGLLCSPCNLGLGAFRDNPRYLLQAIKYLKERGNGVFAEQPGARAG